MKKELFICKKTSSDLMVKRGFSSMFLSLFIFDMYISDLKFIVFYENVRILFFGSGG